MKYISSLDNVDVKKIVSLHEKKGRSQHGLFIVEGLRAITTFIQAGWTVKELYLTEISRIDWQTGPYVKIPFTLVSYDVMKKISTATSPSGFLAIFSMPKSKQEKLSNGIVLVNISDPGNMGTLIRSAVAFDALCIIIDSCDVWSPKVVQATAGVVAYARIMHTDWDNLVKHALTEKIALCALVVDNGKSPRELDLSRSLLVVGSEAHGIPDNYRDQCNQLMTIPTSQKAESLNAAVAGSIALYEQFCV